MTSTEQSQVAERPSLPPPPWYSRFGNAAQIASAVIAFCGFTIVIIQIHDGQTKTAGEAFRAELADARRNYMSYSDATLRYPYLSAPDYNMLMHKHIEYLRYQNYVAHMVYAYDDVLNVIGDSKGGQARSEWLTAFNVDIEPHIRYFCHPKDSRFFQMYRPSIQKLLKEAIGDCKDVPPLVEVPENTTVGPINE